MFKTNEPRTRVPMPKEPADDIKQKAFELPSKLDVAKQSAVKNNQEHNNSYIYNNMTLFEHILVESRVDDFKKMLNRRFSIDYVQKIINRDTSKNHKNLLWIGKILMTEPDINDEDLFKNLEIFNKVGSSTDLYSFKDYMTFLKFLEKKSKEVQMGKMAQIKAGTKTLKDDKRWQMVAPQTHDASKYFGGGTSWCISTSNDRYWKEYYYANTVVMIKDRNKKPNDLLFKVAIVGNAKMNFGVLMVILKKIKLQN